MHRTLLVAAAWAVLVWNLVGVVAFVIGLEAGPSGVVAGSIVASGIILGRTRSARSARRRDSGRVQAEA